jgi:hypothetical protein
VEANIISFKEARMNRGLAEAKGLVAGIMEHTMMEARLMGLRVECVDPKAWRYRVTDIKTGKVRRKSVTAYALEIFLETERDKLANALGMYSATTFRRLSMALAGAYELCSRDAMAMKYFMVMVLGAEEAA